MSVNVRHTCFTQLWVTCAGGESEALRSERGQLDSLQNMCFSSSDALCTPLCDFFEMKQFIRDSLWHRRRFFLHNWTNFQKRKSKAQIVCEGQTGFDSPADLLVTCLRALSLHHAPVSTGGQTGTAALIGRACSWCLSLLDSILL